MLAGKSLTELAAEIERQSNAKRDLVAPASLLTVRAEPEREPELCVQASGYGLQDLAHRQLGEYLTIPANFYDRLRPDREGAQIVDVRRVGVDRPGKRRRLAAFVLVRHDEHRPDVGPLGEHHLVHALGDREGLVLEDRRRGLDDRDRVLTEHSEYPHIEMKRRRKRRRA